MSLYEVMIQKERVAAIIEALKEQKEGSFQLSKTDVRKAPLIKLPIEVFLYNPDNTRNLDNVLDYTGEKDEKIAYQKLYEKRETESVQKIFHDWNLIEAKNSKQNIYKAIRETKVQSEPVKIDGEGILIDGNRRISSMRDLYHNNPLAYKDFKEVECILCTEPGYKKKNRDIAKQVEKFINRSKDLRLEHNWLATAFRNAGEIDDIRGKLSSHNLEEAVQELANDLGMSTKEVYKFLYIRKAVQEYKSFREEYDDNWDKDKDGYSSLAKEQILQDMTEIGSIYFKRIDPALQKLQAETSFVVVLGQKNGYTTYYKRSYELTKAPNQVAELWKKSLKKENVETSKANESLNLLLKKGTEGIKEAAKKIEEQKMIEDDKRKISKESKLVIETIADVNRKLDNLKVSDKTVLKEDVSGIKKNIDTLIEQAEKIKKAVVDIEF